MAGETQRASSLFSITAIVVSMTFVAIGNDVTLLANATTKLLADFKTAEPAAEPAGAKVY